MEEIGRLQAVFEEGQNEINSYYTWAVVKIRSKGDIKLCYVDAGDIPLIKDIKWCITNGYVYNASVGYMHRLITNANESEQVDHKDRNKLNNRRRNLRLVTNQINNFNKGAYSCNNTGFIGVHKNKHGKYESHITLNGIKEHLGSFNEICDAAKAREYRKMEILEELENEQ